MLNLRRRLLKNSRRSGLLGVLTAELPQRAHLWQVQSSSLVKDVSAVALLGAAKKKL